MRIKEVDVWVTYINDLFDDSHGYCEIRNYEPATPTTKHTKAKLVIEIPEKKIVISESQIEAACRSLSEKVGIKDYLPWSDLPVELKKELGFDDV